MNDSVYLLSLLNQTHNFNAFYADDDGALLDLLFSFFFFSFFFVCRLLVFSLLLMYTKQVDITLDYLFSKSFEYIPTLTCIQFYISIKNSKRKHSVKLLVYVYVYIKKQICYISELHNVFTQNLAGFFVLQKHYANKKFLLVPHSNFFFCSYTTSCCASLCSCFSIIPFQFLFLSRVCLYLISQVCGWQNNNYNDNNIRSYEHRQTHTMSHRNTIRNEQTFEHLQTREQLELKYIGIWQQQRFLNLNKLQEEDKKKVR